MILIDFNAKEMTYRVDNYCCCSKIRYNLYDGARWKTETVYCFIGRSVYMELQLWMSLFKQVSSLELLYHIKLSPIK
jgi:hypothetical protein